MLPRMGIRIVICPSAGCNDLCKVFWVRSPLEKKCVSTIGVGAGENSPAR